jgi:hypothetical protein
VSSDCQVAPFGGPAAVFDVELNAVQGLPPVEGGRTRVLVRRDGAPVTLCVVEVPPEGLQPAQLVAQTHVDAAQQGRADAA